VRRVEDPLRRPVVLLELDNLRIGVVALEVEDVADVGAAPAEDRLVVIANDGEVLLEPREVPQENVLGTVGVLVLVDQDVLVAVLPFLERAVARLEHAAGEKQQVVEVDRVVLAQELVVPLPDERRDAVELALRVRSQVSRSLELVLRAGDHIGDRPGCEDLLARVGVAHRLTQHRPLVGLVVDGERTLYANERPFPAQQPRAKPVERPDSELGQALLADQAVEPLPHLLRGLVREGHRQDRARRHRQVADEVGDSVRQDAGLPGPGAGEDEERPVAMCHGGALLGIERIQDRVGHHLHRMKETDC